MLKRNLWSCLLGAVLFVSSLTVQAEDYYIHDLKISGNQRIDSEAIKQNIKAKSGKISADAIDEDVKTLYKTGFFEQVSVNVSGGVLEYALTEKPIVRKVFIKGNEGLSEGDLAEVLDFGERRFVDKTKINGLMRKAISLYQAKGYFDATLDYSIAVVGDNQVDVTFTVDEGTRYKIRKVNFRGIKTLDVDELRDKLMTKRYKWWNSWLFSTGRLNMEMLQNDRNIIKQFMFDNGLIDGQVSEAAIQKSDDGDIEIVFDLVEGPVYHIGHIVAAGDLIEGSQIKTLDGIESERGETFSASTVRNDAFKISEKYSDSGFAYVNVVPNTAIDRAHQAVDLTFSISKGKPVKINKIRIRGNNKTFDNVIRRELKIHEQETYSGSKIKRSKALLERLGYFEEVNITTEELDRDDAVDLDVNVREGSTGSFSVGAGYSSADGAIFNSRLSENNFWGTGRQLTLNVDLGSRRDSMMLSMVDRRVNDSYWSLGGDVFRTERTFSDFDRDLQGAGATVGYPLEEAFGEWAEDINASLRYEYVDIDINDVDKDHAAPLVIKSEGKSSASAITPKLVRNTINNPLNPTNGSKQSVEIETAGLGGSEEYWLFQASNQWYYPFLKTEDYGDLVFSWRTKFGYGKGYGDDDDLPLFRRFFPGGINSVRGFKDRTLGPVDEDGNEYGGSKQFVNNLEMIFPLMNSAGLKGVAFYDMGQAFDDKESLDFGDLRKAYGFGLRWASPLGPIRIEFGFPIDRKDKEDSMVTLFSFGAPL